MRLKKSLPSAVRRKWNSHGGFSYLEMLMVVFILSLCTGVITDTLALGIKHLQERTKHSQAIMLYDTLCAVVRNDLTYATDYMESGGECYFKSNAKDIENLQWVQYGTGNWDANKMVQQIPSPPESYTDVMEWKSTSSGQRAQIIRRGKTYGTDPFYYYTPLTSSQDYSGKGSGGITSNSPLYATIEISVDSGKLFKVKISVYDSLTAATPLMGGDELTVIPIGTLLNNNIIDP